MGVAIFISGIRFQNKAIKKEHYLMIKESIHEEDIILTNIYAPNIGTTNSKRHIKEKLMGIQ